MTNIVKLHQDWPEADLDTKSSWDLPVPYYDLAYALTYAEDGHHRSTPPADRGVRLADVAEVVRYSISYHDEKWSPGDEENWGSFGGTELEMSLVGTLKDGRWFTVEAWNDYTGWGCRDDTDVFLSATESEALSKLTDSARYALGYKVLPASA